MVVTKHFATHGKKYRRRLIKYILNPDKTDNLKLVSDFGMSNYLDFPSYEEMVEMYNVNFTNNDKLYESRNDRQEKHQQNIHAHHLIQSFSPEDNLTLNKRKPQVLSLPGSHQQSRPQSLKDSAIFFNLELEV